MAAWDTPLALTGGDFGTSPSTASGFTAPASGRAVLVIVRGNGISGTVTLADNTGSNTYTLLHTGIDADGANIYFFLALNVTNGPTGYTVSWTGGGSHLPEFQPVFASGLSSTSTLVDNDTSAGGFTDTDSITLTTTGADGALLIGWFSVTSDRDIVPESGLSRFPASGSGQTFVLYSTTDAGTGGSKTLGASFTSAWAVRTCGVALRADGGGGGGSSIVRQMMHYYQ